MVSTEGVVAAFRLYWDDIERCRAARAYWSVLHVVVCLPDICAALASPDGKTKQGRYEAWCASHLSGAVLTPHERYVMRCKVLHQGRASTDEPGRYARFAFAQPTESGFTDHARVQGDTLHVDVGALTDEMRAGVDHWIGVVGSASEASENAHVERNLASLVQVSRVLVVTGLPDAQGRYPVVPMLKTT